MAEGESLAWRDWLAQSHSTLVDELGRRIDSELHGAAEQAAAIARADADLRLAEARQLARQEAEQTRQSHESALINVADLHNQALHQAENRRTRDLEAAAEQHAQDRLAAADLLHQSLRRLRQTTGDTQILKVLNELSSPFAPQSVVVVFENHQARAVSARGLAIDLPAGNELTFDIASAPAVLSAIESRDPVVALLSARELSEPLAEALGVEPGSRAWLFPIVVRQSVVAMVIAAGAAQGPHSGSSVSAPYMELLCDAAAMRLEAAAPAPAPVPASALVQIEGPPAAPGEAPVKLAWDELSTDEQRLHLQAQRMARVRTAEIRLYQSEALQRGAANSDLYNALKPQIDAARTEFLQSYLSKSATMVDYLHLEILRTLARDNDTLLGPEYPGPMV